MPSHCDRVIVARDNDDTDNGEDDSDLRRELPEQHAGNDCQRPAAGPRLGCLRPGTVFCVLQVLCSVFCVLTVYCLHVNVLRLLKQLQSVQIYSWLLLVTDQENILLASALVPGWGLET